MPMQPVGFRLTHLYYLDLLIRLTEAPSLRSENERLRVALCSTEKALEEEKATSASLRQELENAYSSFHNKRYGS